MLAVAFSFIARHPVARSLHATAFLIPRHSIMHIKSSSTSTTHRFRKDTISLNPGNSDPLSNEHEAPHAEIDSESRDSINQLVQTWKDHPSCNQTIVFRSWQFHEGAAIQTLMSSKETQKYLARTHKVPSSLKKPLRLVRDASRLGIRHNADGSEILESKLILLHPETPPIDELPSSTQSMLQGVAVDGPDVPITFTHKDFKPNYLLENLLPMPPPTSFETIGHVAHFNLRPIHFPYRFLIGEVLVASLPLIETVIHKVSEVTGPHRTYEYEVLAGRNDLNVQHIENGVSLHFNLAQVYWSSRLSQERTRLLQDEILASADSMTEKIVVADAFCGVGALCLQAVAADSRVQVLANDWNPEAIRSLEENSRRQKMDSAIQTHCGDAYHYLIDLGVERGELPDHVVMNFPLEAPRFLGALRWWPQSKKSPRIHVYTFIGRDGVNPVPDALSWGITTVEDIDRAYGCNIKVHEVRDVAPGKRVVCVSLTATNELLKAMQGDFD